MKKFTGEKVIVCALSHHDVSMKHQYRRGVIKSEPETVFGKRQVKVSLESRGREPEPYELTIPLASLKRRTATLERMLKEKNFISGNDDAGE